MLLDGIEEGPVAGLERGTDAVEILEIARREGRSVGDRNLGYLVFVDDRTHGHAGSRRRRTNDRKEGGIAHQFLKGDHRRLNRGAIVAYDSFDLAAVDSALRVDLVYRKESTLGFRNAEGVRERPGIGLNNPDLDRIGRGLSERGGAHERTDPNANDPLQISRLHHASCFCSGNVDDAGRGAPNILRKSRIGARVVAADFFAAGFRRLSPGRFMSMHAPVAGSRCPAAINSDTTAAYHHATPEYDI